MDQLRFGLSQERQLSPAKCIFNCWLQNSRFLTDFNWNEEFGIWSEGNERISVSAVLRRTKVISKIQTGAKCCELKEERPLSFLQPSAMSANEVCRLEICTCGQVYLSGMDALLIFYVFRCLSCFANSKWSISLITAQYLNNVFCNILNDDSCKIRDWTLNTSPCKLVRVWLLCYRPRTYFCPDLLKQKHVGDS